MPSVNPNGSLLMSFTDPFLYGVELRKSLSPQRWTH